MATNIKMEPGYRLSVVCSDPATPATGDPVRFGNMVGIALTDEGEGQNAATETTVYFGPCVVSLSVKGVDGSGNSAVAVGDSLYYVDADTPKVSKKASGYFVGFALATVGSGSTATIDVYKPMAGAWVGTVNTGDIATGAVTAAKLSTTLKTGFIPVSLASVRELSTGSFINAAGNGGLLATDTTPILNTINGDTDGCWRLAWASSNSDAIGFQVPLPPDLDDASDITVKVRAYMAGATDTPTLSIDSYFDEGDTKVTDTSTALNATPTTKSITIAAADYPASATLSVELTPGAHTTDILYVTAIWIEYVRA